MFSLALVVDELVINNFGTFQYLKVEKHIWDQCCHLGAETGADLS